MVELKEKRKFNYLTLALLITVIIVGALLYFQVL